MFGTVSLHVPFGSAPLFVESNTTVTHYNKELHHMTEQSQSSTPLQGKVKLEAFPPEIIELLKILARIEARRQARLRAQKGCE